MAIRKGLPAKLALTDADDSRYLFSGLVVCNVDGSPRGGVLSPVGVNLVTATGTMNVSVIRNQAVAERDGGVVLLANDGPTNVLLDAAPGANSRIDVIYEKQNDASATVTVPDGDNLPVLGFVKGTAAGIPVKPALPVGAVELATVQIPSTATATNSGGVVITQTAQFTATAGGVVPFRTKTEMNLWVTPGLDQKANVGGLLYTWDGSSWVSVTAGTVTAGASVTLNASTKLTRDGSGMVTLNLFAVRSSGNFAINDVIASFPVGFRPEVPVDGSILGSGFAFPGVVAAGIRIYDNGNALFVGPASQNTFIGTATYKAAI